MKISNFNSNILFGKTIAATCQVKKKSGDFEQCKIYKLDKKEDYDYFLKLMQNQDWEDSSFVEIVNNLTLSPYVGLKSKTYTLEDGHEVCLGYIRTLSEDFDDEKKEKIVYLETCPKFSSKNKKREIKYIGQSLLAFVVGLAKKEDTDKVYIPSYAPNAKKFYEKKCKFKHNKEDGLVLTDKNYDKFLKKYEQNTKCKIKYYI